MPLTAASSANTACIEGSSNPAQTGNAGCADGTDDRQRVGGEQRGVFNLSLAALCGGIRSIPRIAKLGTLCLPGSQSGSCALGNEPALLLGQGGVEVQHEGIGIA